MSGKKIMISAMVGAVSILLLAGCSKKAEESATAAGMAAIEQLDYQGALEQFEKALVSGEDTELVYRGEGIAKLALTDYEGAIEAFGRALGAADTAGRLEVDINYYLAAAYHKAGMTQEAIDVYNAILGMYEKETDAYFFRGTLELKQNQYDAAIEDFQKALSLAPSDYGLYIDIYTSLEEYGYTEAALQYLTDALAKEDKGMTDYDKGRLYYYQKDYNNARDCLERAKDSGPDAVLFLGRTYEALGDNNYAASVYTNYLSANENNAQIANQLGLCKLSLGEYEEALQAFQKGLEIENSSCRQSLAFNEIVAYEYLGEFQKATVQMQTYIQNYPDDEAAAREYGFLKTR